MRIITLSNGERISSQIFDLSGHEKYQDYIVGFMRSANGVVFMYDVTDESSFQSKYYILENPCTVFVGFGPIEHEI